MMSSQDWFFLGTFVAVSLGLLAIILDTWRMKRQLKRINEAKRPSTSPLPNSSTPVIEPPISRAVTTPMILTADGSLYWQQGQSTVGQQRQANTLGHQANQQVVGSQFGKQAQAVVYPVSSLAGGCAVPEVHRFVVPSAPALQPAPSLADQLQLLLTDPTLDGLTLEEIGRMCTPPCSGATVGRYRRCLANGLPLPKQQTNEARAKTSEAMRAANLRRRKPVTE